uniref:proteoglycan 4-like n=1 Tax=Scatophagus argus TaxID=75038 RepID=UPI001ED7E2E2|nr:proteoglycan 4-like [Scatophagus argus]
MCSHKNNQLFRQHGSQDDDWYEDDTSEDESGFEDDSYQGKDNRAKEMEVLELLSKKIQSLDEEVEMLQKSIEDLDDERNSDCETWKEEKMALNEVNDQLFKETEEFRLELERKSNLLLSLETEAFQVHKECSSALQENQLLEERCQELNISIRSNIRPKIELKKQVQHLQDCENSIEEIQALESETTIMAQSIKEQRRLIEEICKAEAEQEDELNKWRARVLELERQKLRRSATKPPLEPQPVSQPDRQPHPVCLVETPLEPQPDRPDSVEAETPLEPQPDRPDSVEAETPLEPQPDRLDSVEAETPLEPQPDRPDSVEAETPLEPQPDRPDSVEAETPLEPQPDRPDSVEAETPLEPQPDRPDSVEAETPLEPQPDRPDSVEAETPLEPQPDRLDSVEAETPLEPQPDRLDSVEAETPLEPQPDRPDQQPETCQPTKRRKTWKRLTRLFRRK